MRTVGARRIRKSSALTTPLTLILLTAAACAAPTATSDPGDTSAFWDALRIAGDEVEGYARVDVMAARADAVLVGRVSSVGLSRTIQGDASEDLVALAMVRVTVVKMLSGTAPPEVAVEFLLPSPRESVDEQIAALVASAPQGEMVLFLRAKRGRGEEGLYRVVNSSGLWAATIRHALDTPLAEGPPAETGMFASETSGWGTLDDLVAYLDSTGAHRP
jgi:hypothetical protein